MILYTTPATPYGRLVRAVLHETGLAAKVQIEFIKTRTPDCVLHPMNPTGKVPTLVLDDGEALSEARLICGYLDGLHGQAPVMRLSPSPPERQLEGVLCGFTDGIAVWVREARRPESEQSSDILAQEQARVGRVLPWLERHVAELDAASRYVQLLAYFALEALEQWLEQGEALSSHKATSAWYEQQQVELAR